MTICPDLGPAPPTRKQRQRRRRRPAIRAHLTGDIDRLADHERETARAKPAPRSGRATFVRAVASTAAFSVGAQGAAALAGIIIARYLGPEARGHYTAAVAWSGLAIFVGQFGQSAATTYFVAKRPADARDFLATSRAMVLGVGFAAVAAGMAIAPLLAHGDSTVTAAYRFMFGSALVGILGASYTSALQAVSVARWNPVRSCQPLLFLVAVLALLAAGHITLWTVLPAIAGTLLLQTVLAYGVCRRLALTGGRATLRLIRPLARYGAGQLASTTPAVVNMHLDQLILSVAVPAADLGRYAVAVTLTTLAVPIISALGYVAFPLLASQMLSRTRAIEVQRLSALASFGAAVVVVVPIAAGATWIVPAVFGEGFRPAVVLVWILAPGGVFLACGQVCADLLRGDGKPGAVAQAQGIGAAVTVTMLGVLLPVLGVAAAAITSTVAYGVALTVMSVKLHRGRRAGLPGGGIPA
ncbi:MAG: hypothetical protein QOI35_2265 [Cryptosporangiaceae bacterium]|nr:hypothetical protein [Cryptosporangiaceae bacterium]